MVKPGTVTNWSIYQSLTKKDWRPGDEPMVKNKITIRQGQHTYVVPLPEGVSVEYTQATSAQSTEG